MKLGIIPINIGQTDGGFLRDVGLAAEGAGVESVWTYEHVIAPRHPSTPYPYAVSGQIAGFEEANFIDPPIALTWIASATTTLKLGTGILILPQRHPVMVAKWASSLATLSNDRLVLGVGIGWLKEEMEALGVPFDERVARMEDSIDVMRKLWAGKRVSHDSDFTSFDEISMNPSPPGGRVPLVLAGHSDKAARRAGRLGDGFFPVSHSSITSQGPGAAVARVAELIQIARDEASANGRDPDALEVTVQVPAQAIAAMAEPLHQAGVSRVLTGLDLAQGDALQTIAGVGGDLVSALAQTSIAGEPAR